MQLIHLALAAHLAFSSYASHGDVRTSRGEMTRSDELSRIVFQMQTGAVLRLQMADGSLHEGTFVQMHDGTLDINSERTGKVLLVMNDVSELWEYGRDGGKSALWGIAVGATLGAFLGVAATREAPTQDRIGPVAGLGAIGGILGGLMGGFADHATKEWHQRYP